MTLSPLEIVMGSALLSLVVGLVVHLVTRNKYVCQAVCAEKHRSLDSQVSKLFTGMKLLVLHSKEIPMDEKATLLSEGRKE